MVRHCIRTLSGHSGGIWSVAFSADDHVITSGSDDQLVLSWETTSGQRLQTLQGYSSRVYAITMNEVSGKKWILTDLQGLNSPHRPLSDLSSRQRDKFLAQVGRDIINTVIEITTS
jgi:WD40 repeat protein